MANPGFKSRSSDRFSVEKQVAKSIGSKYWRKYGRNRNPFNILAFYILLVYRHLTHFVAIS